jgi:hypothetical protein
VRYLLAGVLIAAKAEPGLTVVAVDGGAAAGKSTLVERLRNGVSAVGTDPTRDARSVSSAVVHTDDLLEGWGDPLGYVDRFREQVLGPLSAGQAACYQRYDWKLGRFADSVRVEAVDLLLVDGVASVAACGDRLSVGIVLVASRADRERRWRRRDGPLGPSEQAWLAAEAAYLDSLDSHPAPLIRVDAGTGRLMPDTLTTTPGPDPRRRPDRPAGPVRPA